MESLLKELTIAVAKLTEEVSALAIDLERQNDTARQIEANVAGRAVA